MLIPPRVVPSIQATLAEEGPGNVAAKVMQTGKHTTDYYTSDQKATKPKKGSGLKINTVYATTAFPIFPLATTDGGGIVLYALSRDAVSIKNKKKPGHVPIPKDAAPFIAPDRVHNELDVTQTLQFATLVPPKPKKGETHRQGHDHRRRRRHRQGRRPHALTGCEGPLRRAGRGPLARSGRAGSP